MAKVQFNGRADTRVLSADDLKRHGVEGFKKTSFPKGVPTEVSDEVANTLLEKPNVFGKFALVDENGEVVEQSAPSKKAQAEANEAEGATSQESTGTPSTTTGTGSTSGSTSGRASTRTT